MLPFPQRYHSLLPKLLSMLVDREYWPNHVQIHVQVGKINRFLPNVFPWPVSDKSEEVA